MGYFVEFSASVTSHFLIFYSGYNDFSSKIKIKWQLTVASNKFWSSMSFENLVRLSQI
jgi:hypothetical protein